MAAQTRSVRLQVNTTADVALALERMAKKVGISRNAMCAVLLHEAVKSELGESERPEGPPLSDKKEAQSDG